MLLTNVLQKQPARGEVFLEEDVLKVKTKFWKQKLGKYLAKIWEDTNPSTPLPLPPVSRGLLTVVHY